MNAPAENGVTVDDPAEQPPKPPELSVIVPVSERYNDVSALYRAYRDAIWATTRNVEFVYVLDGPFEKVFQELQSLRAAGERIRIIRLSRRFGESTALTQGVEHAASDTILALPAYYQVEPDALTEFVNDLDGEDMLVVRRWPRIDSTLNRMSTNIFHKILRSLTGYGFRDVGCGVRLIRRRVLEEITLYGDQHRFLPMLAAQRGFSVREVDLPQARQDPKVRLYRPNVYLQRVLDLLAVLFLVRFTKRPLRFFGLVGSFVIGFGALVLAILVFERLFLGQGLADRPALLFGALFFVLGFQLIAVGLIGELIIFTHARDLKEYTVARTVNIDPPTGERPSEGDPPTS